MPCFGRVIYVLCPVLVGPFMYCALCVYIEEGIWVSIDQHRTRTMAHLWRPIPRYSFHFGVRPGEEVRPVDEEQGYCLQVWRRGHKRCLCLLSEDTWFFFRPHHHATGEFPMHYLASQMWADEFVAAHPEYDVGNVGYGN